MISVLVGVVRSIRSVMGSKTIKINSKAQEFFDDIASSYEQVTSTVGYSLFELTKSFYCKYGILSGSILDAGCGTGKLKLILGNNFDYTGIDFSENMLSLARTRGYETILGSLEDVLNKIEDKSYDHVVCLSVLYFIEGAESVIRHLERIAKQTLIVGFEKYSEQQLKMVFNGYDGVRRYNHSSALIKNPTEVIKDYLFWTYASGEKIYGDFVFKKLI